ncbi:hypothetical protein GB937_004319 [Aspergillus fischeri]|nr:hypothetical protein GB937_004319 [Aspergillus fischeri]
MFRHGFLERVAVSRRSFVRWLVLGRNHREEGWIAYDVLPYSSPSFVSSSDTLVRIQVSGVWMV